MKIGALALVAVVAMGCDEKRTRGRLTPRSFPGFTISLPQGGTEGAAERPNAQSVHYDDVGVSVTLAVSPLADLTPQRINRQLGGGTYHVMRVPGPGGALHETIVRPATEDTRPIRFTLVRCAEHMVWLTLAGPVREIEAWHARILPTIACAATPPSGL